MNVRRTTDQLRGATMRGKWAEGIPPRNFHWILKDQLAIAERPGGYGTNHRPVRRLEEIIWIRQQRFDLVMSLIAAPHNLHNYEEEGVRAVHRPLGSGELDTQLLAVYREIHELRRQRRRLFVHHEELGDRVCGFTAGYLVWSATLDSAPRAITAVEQITARQLGPLGREIVTVAAGLTPPDASPAAGDPDGEPT